MTCHLLIVDDSKLARMSVARLLKGLRPVWTVSEAANAEDALAMISSHRPDIALVDFNLPGQDGLVLIAGLRALAPDMPVALLTANFQNEIIAKASQLGATFLSKPLTETALAEYLADVDARS